MSNLENFISIFSYVLCFLIAQAIFFFTKGLFTNDSWPIINICFFGILQILPYTNPIKFYFQKSKDFNINSKPINEIYFKFFNDYQRQNPFTKKEGLYFYINELKKRGYVTKFIYDILIKNIEKINVMEIYYNSTLNPSLKEAQRTLTKFQEKQFSMDDLKKSITRIFKEKLQRTHKLNNDKMSSQKTSKDLANSAEINNDDFHRNVSRNDSNNSLDSLMSNESADSEISNSSYENSNIGSNDSIDDFKNKERKISDDSAAYNKNKYQVLNSGSFLINQYKNPLLLSIGQGIKNLTFMDNYKDYKRFKKEIKEKIAQRNEGIKSKEREIDLSTNKIWEMKEKKRMRKNNLNNNRIQKFIN